MKAAVFNEYLIGVHARDNYAGQKNSGPGTLKGFRIRARTQRIWFQGNSRCSEEFQVGAIADKRKNKIVRNCDFPVRRLNSQRILVDFHYIRVKVRRDLSVLNPVLDIRLDPIFDRIRDRWAAVY